MTYDELVERARAALAAGIDVRVIEYGLRTLGASRQAAKAAISHAKRQTA